jgi:uncharacterized protein
LLQIRKRARFQQPGNKNLVVLLVLYPVVFLFGKWVQTPFLVDRGVPFWLALFGGNAVSVALLGWALVPMGNRAFDWWLRPLRRDTLIETAGTGLILLLCGLFLLAFWQCH